MDRITAPCKVIQSGRKMQMRKVTKIISPQPLNENLIPSMPLTKVGFHSRLCCYFRSPLTVTLSSSVQLMNMRFTEKVKKLVPHFTVNVFIYPET